MMTRQEWFDLQTKKVQQQFVYNCNFLNAIPLFKDWIKQTEPITKGITGAFRWSKSNQGHEYWSKIDKKIKQ
jgi:hypothetical protein